MSLQIGQKVVLANEDLESLTNGEIIDISAFTNDETNITVRCQNSATVKTAEAGSEAESPDVASRADDDVQARVESERD